MTFISSYASIKNQRLSRNGAVLWDGAEEVSLENFLLRAYEFLVPAYPKFYKMDQLSKLGFLACEVLVGNRKLKEEYKPDHMALILSNSSSSLDTDRKYVASTAQLPSPSLFVYTLPNIVAGEICIRHGIKGETAFFISREFDTKLIAGFAEHVFSYGTEACIAGWVETHGKTHDVFLYLIEKEKAGLGIEHLAANVSQLYHT